LKGVGGGKFMVREKKKKHPTARVFFQRRGTQGVPVGVGTKKKGRTTFKKNGKKKRAKGKP